VSSRPRARARFLPGILVRASHGYVDVYVGTSSGAFEPREVLVGAAVGVVVVATSRMVLIVLDGRLGWISWRDLEPVA